MGCDGGTIPRRDELVRVKKKPEKADQNAETAAKWKHCAITQQRLQKPIVACELGKMYNKEAVIEYLLSKDATVAEIVGHIKSLSDIKELNLTEHNGYKEKKADKGDEYVDVNVSQFVCPVTGLEMNGKQKFCFHWKCGCVLSEKAIKEVKSDVCHKCGIPADDNDLIIIHGSDDEVSALKKRMEERRLKAKMERKKRKQSQASASSSSDEKKPKFDEPGPSKASSSKDEDSKKLPEPAKNTIKNGTSNGITAKKLLLPQKALPEYSIAKDPKASAALKSLFTSADKAKDQGKAHWVTYNPCYY